MDLLTKVIILIAAIAGLSIVLYFEVRYMRRRRSARIDSRMIRDDAYNAVTTAKAVAQSLRGRGYDTEEAELVLEEAELAYGAGSYARTKELAKKARSLLQESREKKETDPFDSILTSQQEGADTAKTLKAEEERLPENYMESKFMIANARRSVDQAASGGRGAIEGSRLLKEAEASFDKEDYTEALRLACLSKKRAEGVWDDETCPETKEVPEVEPELTAEICANCGAQLEQGDTYCGSCGGSVDAPLTCPECGAEMREGDMFCRKCGARLESL